MHAYIHTHTHLHTYIHTYIHTYTHTYLGAIITDTGNLSHDIRQHSKSKQPSVSIKLTNFIRNNKYCPMWIKLKVLTTCVNSSLLYGCETWSNNSFDCIEKIHRKGLKCTKQCA